MSSRFSKVLGLKNKAPFTFGAVDRNFGCEIYKIIDYKGFTMNSALFGFFKGFKWRFLLPLSLLLLLGACANQRPKEAVDYSSLQVAPAETDSFVLINSKQFDQPELGAGYNYVDRKYPDDKISLYIYPIAKFDWTDIDSTLEEEMARVIAEINYAVNAGIYDSAKVEGDAVYPVEIKGIQYQGRRAELKIEKGEQTLSSFAYIFIDEDKFIKFRISFNAQLSPGWTGDEAVAELLPEIKVPPESAYMNQLRAKAKADSERQVHALIKKLLTDAIKTEEEGQSSEQSAEAQAED